ncbi:cysteine rich repeat-containing protein [Bradyrhizobium genosp. P]|uniref:cysteine rich repeat-containing protein n=1 Tax=Bradyrhizobium genosp. P TaxID=83641 RepID=UPI003CF94E6E
MISIVLVGLFLLAGVSLSVAQSGHPGTPQEQQACSRDASRFCRKQLGDEGAVQQCLQQNRSELSSACRKVYESHGM